MGFRQETINLAEKARTRVNSSTLDAVWPGYSSFLGPKDPASIPKVGLGPLPQSITQLSLPLDGPWLNIPTSGTYVTASPTLPGTTPPPDDNLLLINVNHNSTRTLYYRVQGVVNGVLMTTRVVKGDNNSPVHFRLNSRFISGRLQAYTINPDKPPAPGDLLEYHEAIVEFTSDGVPQNENEHTLHWNTSYIDLAHLPVVVEAKNYINGGRCRGPGGEDTLIGCPVGENFMVQTCPSIEYCYLDNNGVQQTEIVSLKTPNRDACQGPGKFCSRPENRHYRFCSGYFEEEIAKCATNYPGCAAAIKPREYGEVMTNDYYNFPTKPTPIPNHEEPWYRASSFNVWSCGFGVDPGIGVQPYAPNLFFNGIGGILAIPPGQLTPIKETGNFWCAAIQRGIVSDPDAPSDKFFSNETVSSPYAKWVYRTLNCKSIYTFPYSDIPDRGGDQQGGTQTALLACASLEMNVVFSPNG